MDRPEALYTGTRAFTPSVALHPITLFRSRGQVPRTYSPAAAAAAVAARARPRSGLAARGGAGGLPLEAVEALEAAACVAREAMSTEAFGALGTPCIRD